MADVLEEFRCVTTRVVEYSLWGAGVLVEEEGDVVHCAVHPDEAPLLDILDVLPSARPLEPGLFIFEEKATPTATGRRLRRVPVRMVALGGRSHETGGG